MTVPVCIEEFCLISLGPLSASGRTAAGKPRCLPRNARPHGEDAPDHEGAPKPEGAFDANGLLVEERQEGGVELVGVAHIDPVRTTRHHMQVTADDRGVGACS